MPRTSHLPPTPAPSTDITGKEKAIAWPSDHVFSLPPSAINARQSSASDDTAEVAFAACRPLSPTSPVEDVRFKLQTSIASIPEVQSSVTLPPPPTRSRKIIQMKPGVQHATKSEVVSETTELSGEKTKPGTAAGSKRKQGATTSAGRKIARKTAHSIIERRRRSKMNEEFGVLKDMIPACSGQEMHKLAILQASIEYLRYLEQCVSDLKAGRTQQLAPSPVLSDESTPNYIKSAQPAYSDDESDVAMDDEDEMNEDESSRSQFPSVSNSIYSATTTSPAFSSTSQHSVCRISTFELPRPECESISTRWTVQHADNSRPGSCTTTPLALSNHTSPLIIQESRTESDHEVSAALLLLNAIDRRMVMPPPLTKPSSIEIRERCYQRSSRARGMSVQDLLRT